RARIAVDADAHDGVDEAAERRRALAKRVLLRLRHRLRPHEDDAQRGPRRLLRAQSTRAHRRLIDRCVAVARHSCVIHVLVMTPLAAIAFVVGTLAGDPAYDEGLRLYK